MIDTLELNQVKPLSLKVDQSSKLTLAGIPISDLAKQYGTPLYLMCEETVEKRAIAYREAFEKHYPNSIVMYASKALNCKAICRMIAQLGLGIDVVSAGELYTALASDFPVDKIIFHGNNKSELELEMSVVNGIYAVVLDNFYEFDLLTEVLRKFPNKKIGILIRVTPGIECHTHEYIKTGRIDSKFGFNLDQVDSIVQKILQNPQMNLYGLHAHIGSQIFELVPHNDTVGVLLDLYKQIQNKYSIQLPDLNVGGGLGIMYTEQDDPPSIESWVKIIADAVKSNCARLGLQEPRVMVEPGRSIVGPAGLTVYQIGNIKDIPGVRKYVAIDGGMADNSRPIMYQAKYTAQIDGKNTNLEKLTIAGRYCESGDILIHDIELPSPSSGDLLVVYSTGAYNYSMSSNYNRSCRPAMIGVKSSQSRVLIERETLEDLLRLDR